MSDQRQDRASLISYLAEACLRLRALDAEREALADGIMRAEAGLAAIGKLDAEPAGPERAAVQQVAFRQVARDRIAQFNRAQFHLVTEVEA